MRSTRLGDILDIQSGFAFKTEFFSDTKGIPLIRIRDLPNTSTETSYQGEFREEFIVEPGEYLIGMDGNWDRLRPQVVELTTFALTLLGPSGGVATNQSWASATRADRRGFSLCACPRERRDNSSTSASDRGDPGSHDDGGPDASAPHC